jgi:hypothetical protein
MALEPLRGRPPFSSLPLDPDGPPGNAWGLYGDSDALGALNLLTPAVVLAAASEIRTGERVSLDWPLNKPSYPSFDRPPFESRLINRSKAGEQRTVNDDVLNFNTQCSSQWDGFRHYGQSSRRSRLAGFDLLSKYDRRLPEGEEILQQSYSRGIE